MKEKFEVLRSHLKWACDNKDWDMLDHLLELDSSGINDNSLYTDTWGEWWGMLLECVYHKQTKGVMILLQRGADPALECWGDCLPVSPEKAAADDPKLNAIFQDPESHRYTRKGDPLPPNDLGGYEQLDQQAKFKKKTGFFFPTDDQLRKPND